MWSEGTIRHPMWLPASTLGNSAAMGMTTNSPAILPRVAAQKARGVERRPWFRVAARSGLAARGVIYGLLAYFAADIALHGTSPAQTSGSGALTDVAHQPGAPVLLAILGAGLLAYAAWRVLMAVGPPSGSEMESAAKRIGWLAIAVVYLILFAQAVSLIAGSGGTSGGLTAQPTPFVGRTLRWPGGPELVGLAAVALICSGIGLAVWAFAHNFDEDYDTRRMSRGAYFGARASQILGDVTRGALVVLIGVYLLVGAVTDDPIHVKSLGQALQTLARRPDGTWLIGAAAVGLFAFAVSSIFESLYRKL